MFTLSSEIQGQLLGAGKSLRGREKNSGEEIRTIKVNSVIIRLGLSSCFGFGEAALKCFDLFGIEYKILDFSRP